MTLVSVLIPTGGKPGDFKHFSGHVALTGLQEPQRGHLLCNGVFVSQATYAKLFAQCGHRYNNGVDPGDGNFRLPNYLDKIAVFKGPTKTSVGSSGGVLGHTHTLENHHHAVPSHGHSMQSHVHSLSSHTHSFTTGGPSVGDTVGVASVNPTMTVAAHTHTGSVNGTGSNTDAVAGNTDANSATTSDTTTTTGAADPPFTVVGARLIRYI